MFKFLVDIDVRKVTAVISILVVLELAISQGTISLTDAIPASWIPVVVAWSKILAVVGSAITGTHNVAALFSPRGDSPSLSSNPAVKALMILAVLLASLIFAVPAMAANNGPVPVKKPLLSSNITVSTARPVFCDPLNLIPGCKNPDGSTAPKNALDPLDFLRQFSNKDLANALADANGQNPPNATSAQCWTYLLTLVPAPTPAPAPSTGTADPSAPATPAPAPDPATSLLPATLGVASAIQKALDDQQLLVTWLSPGGGLEKLNLACAPLVNMVNARLLSGAGITAAAGAALTNPATAPLIVGLQTLLTGVIALAPIK